MMDKKTIERDPEIKVWALNEEGAFGFFGYKRHEVTIRVIQTAPESEHERAKYRPDAKLFGITVK